MGTREQKDELAVEVIGSGATPQAIQEVFRTCAATVPCVYMFRIGTARKLLGDKYKEGDVLFKYGCANDFTERCLRLEREYKREFNVKTITSFQYCIVEPKYKFEAEKSLKHFLENYHIDYKTKKEENKKELVVINKCHFNSVIQHFTLLRNSYVGRLKETEDKIKELETELEKQALKHENEMKLKDKDIEIKEMKYKYEILEHKYTISQKDCELALLRK
jgi:hypothetical protein